ncbi:MAG TPA: TonB-dependent receptor [Bryobacteraceae bacterium]
MPEFDSPDGASIESLQTRPSAVGMALSAGTACRGGFSRHRQFIGTFVTAASLLVSGFLLTQVRLHAQALSGSIVGTVLDQAGAAVPTANVTLRNGATGFQRLAATNSSGQYAADNIPTGTYTINVKAAGFQTLSRSGVQLNYGQTVTVDLRLTVGAVEQTVNVHASAPLLQAQTGTVSVSITNREVQQLPSNGRVFTSLLLQSPGAVVGSSSNVGTGVYASLGSVNYSVNGSSAQMNSYLLDGLFNRGLWLSTLVMVPVLDSIQEMNVLTSNYDAQYGSSAGAVTIVETKSGTNQFHGDVFEYLQNTDLNANNFFNNSQGISRPALHYNQFGGTFGGPIIKNKTFFFADYQGTRRSEPLTFTSTIPTVAERDMVETGDFSGLGTPIYNPFTTVTNAQGQTVRSRFPGNLVPAAVLDSAAVKLMGLLPTPTNPGKTNNFTYNPAQTQDINQFDLRADQNLGAGDRFFVKYSFIRSIQDNPGVLPAPANSSIPVGPYLGNNGDQAFTAPMQNQSGTIDYVKVISPTTINDAQVGVLRWTLSITPTDTPFDSAKALGIPGINIDDKSGGLPGFLITGFQTIGDNNTFPEDSFTTTYQYDDNLTLVRGSHTFKFGGVYLRNAFNGFSAYPIRGTYNFNGQFTRQIGASTSATALSDFALGVPSAVTRAHLVGTFGMRFWQIGAYAQDTWRVNNRLTLTYGARYDLFAPPYDVHNHWSNLNLQTSLIEVAGIKGNGRRLVNFDTNNVQPRVGLAYTLTSDRKTVLRGGFGTSYVIPGQGGGELYKNPPFFSNQVVSTDQNGIPPITITDGLPVPTVPSVTDTAALSSGSPNVWDQNLNATKVMDMSIGVQRQLVPNLMLSTAYVRTRTFGLLDNLNINQSVPGPGGQGPRRPYYSINPNLVNITVRGNHGDATYNALQVQLQKRFSQGLTFNVSYTWSKNLSDGGNVNGGGNWAPQDARCIACMWGPTPDDRTQVLVINHTYQLPFGTGRKYLRSGVLGAVLGDWDVDGIWTFMSGLHFSPTWGTNVSNSAGGGAQRPNRVCNGNLGSSERSLSHYFDTTCFVAPAQFNFGNSGSGILVGPGDFNVDLGIHRIFPIGERFRIAYRAEMFNAFNHANFGTPNSTIGTANAGVISSADDGRVIQMALKLTF